MLYAVRCSNRREEMNIPELFTSNWQMKLLSLVIALLIWYFITSGA